MIGALVAVIDPELVVIGGGVSRSFERLRPGVERRLGEIVPVPPPVVASNLVPDAVVFGAIDAARELADTGSRSGSGSDPVRTAVPGARAPEREPVAVAPWDGMPRDGTGPWRPRPIQPIRAGSGRRRQHPGGVADEQRLDLAVA